MKYCHRCGAPWETGKKIPAVKEFCGKCSAYLHCCLNCRFHDTSRPNQCRIPNTDQVADRAGANFCDEFEFEDTEAVRSEEAALESSRQTLTALFGEGQPSSAGGLESLFGEERPKQKSFDDLFQ
ncbi:MAG: hypothetical protein HYV26_03205 [Candidatus Hydrogenedentes bacterium]|nr:hypothetical protein [Candidatus Hydrogenedentota bacterium]